MKSTIKIQFFFSLLYFWCQSKGKQRKKIKNQMIFRCELFRILSFGTKTRLHSRMHIYSRLFVSFYIAGRFFISKKIYFLFNLVSDKKVQMFMYNREVFLLTVCVYTNKLCLYMPTSFFMHGTKFNEFLIKKFGSKKSRSMWKVCMCLKEADNFVKRTEFSASKCE